MESFPRCEVAGCCESPAGDCGKLDDSVMAVSVLKSSQPRTAGLGVLQSFVSRCCASRVHSTRWQARKLTRAARAS